MLIYVCVCEREREREIYIKDVTYLRVLHMVFHWSVSDSKSPQVSKTLHSILADLSDPVA